MPPLPYREIAMIYRNVLLTPKDYASHYKNILHRRLMVRSFAPKDGNNSCRCCGKTIEHIHHIASCEVIGPAFDKLFELAAIAGYRPARTQELILLAVDGEGMMPGGITNLLIISALVLTLTCFQTLGKHSCLNT